MFLGDTKKFPCQTNQRARQEFLSYNSKNSTMYTLMNCLRIPKVASIRNQGINQRKLAYFITIRVIIQQMQSILSRGIIHLLIQNDIKVHQDYDHMAHTKSYGNRSITEFSRKVYFEFQSNGYKEATITFMTHEYKVMRK